MTEQFYPRARIGKYQLVRKLGEGGFGVVYVARDTSLERDVAVKFLRAEHTANPEVVKRFLQEARSVARVAHPGIVTVYECGTVAGTNTPADGAAFIVMELLSGESLADRLKRTRRLSPVVAMELCRQVASAVHAAHQAGIIHRDLKPDNIFIVADPDLGERAKVLDFGIAKLAQQDRPLAGAATHAHMVFGTPQYMSPEQCRSSTNIDHRSDVYSLGCILYELLTGETVFAGEPFAQMVHHVATPAPLVNSTAPGVPESLSQVVATMLAKDPSHRFASMARAARALAVLARSITPGEATCEGAVIEPTMPPDDMVRALVPTPAAAPAASAIRKPLTTLGTAAGESMPPGLSTLRTHRATWKWVAGAGTVALLVMVAIAAVARHGDHLRTVRASSSVPAPSPALEPVVVPVPPAATVDEPARDTFPADAAVISHPTAQVAAPVLDRHDVPAVQVVRGTRRSVAVRPVQSGVMVKPAGLTPPDARPGPAATKCEGRSCVADGKF